MAKFLANENVPGTAVEAARRAGVDITWVRDVSPGISDEAVLTLAQAEGRVLLTFDKDFGEMAFEQGKRPIWRQSFRRRSRTTAPAPSGCRRDYPWRANRARLPTVWLGSALYRISQLRPPTAMETQLCPAQQAAFDGLAAGLAHNHIFVLSGDTGMGKTTVLRAVHRNVAGVFLSMKDFLDAHKAHHPLALEETFASLVMDALAAHDHVIVDDLHLLAAVVSGCGAYPRVGLLNIPLTVLATYAAEAGKKLIFGCSPHPPDPIHQRSLDYRIHDFQPADYRFLCHTFLGEKLAAPIDYAKLHRFAPHLNAHLLSTVCPQLRSRADLGTAEFIEFLRSFGLTSNVDLEEVQQVDLRDLKGIDGVIRSLETNIILPLENDDLATELGLKPKRGVLLLGPPGTGKTTVGRALAHRLKGKFFLIDGTFIAGTDHF
jgi:predicted AAA+ superfamily ATPase